MDIKLIPKEYKHGKEEVEIMVPFTNTPAESKLLIGVLQRINIWLWLTIIIGLISLIGGGGALIYGQAQDKQMADLDEQIVDLNKQRDYDLEADIADLGKAIIQLTQLMDNHVYPSKVFKVLHEFTVCQVQYNSFQANLSASTIDVRGLAANWDIMAQQLTALKNDARVIDMNSTDIRLDNNNKIQFGLSINLDPDYLHYQKK